MQKSTRKAKIQSSRTNKAQAAGEPEMSDTQERGTWEEVVDGKENVSAPDKQKPEVTEPPQSAEQEVNAQANGPDASASTTPEVKEEITEPKTSEVKEETTQPKTEITTISPSKTEEDKDGDGDEEEVPKKAPVQIVKDPRDHLNVIFIGHVDAGKSTVAGNILVLTGMVDQRTIEKYEREAKEHKRESWFLAYIMDTSEEERVKGITVECGRAHFETPVRRFTILDAPGHKGYVPNMIGGASQADVGILVVSARKGEFETGFEKAGQTREHAMLAKTLGINKLVVVINKMDDKTVEWKKERFDEIVSKLSPFLRGVGYDLKKNVIFLPISGLTGKNVKEPFAEGECPWYKGPSLLQILDKIPPPLRKPDAPLRIPVQDKIREAGKLYIQGKVESGTIKVGQTVTIMPNNDVGKVLSLTTDICEMEEAGPGENIRFAISGVPAEHISPGFVVSGETDVIKPHSKFEAQLAIVSLLKTKPVFSPGYEAVLHVHSAVEDCTIERLVDIIDKETGKPSGKRPRIAAEGDVVIVIIKTAQPVCIENFAKFPQLGRFTLRDEGKTIAIGKITRLPGEKAAEKKTTA